MNAAAVLCLIKRTSVFDENTLPAGLHRRHCTKIDVWGKIRVLDGQLRYQVLDPTSECSFSVTIPASYCPMSRTSSSRSDPCGCRSSSTISCLICSGSCPRPALQNTQIGIR